MSAVSGIPSRSPSPSIKPVENIPMDVLDQAILARKQELQQDFRVELARNGRRGVNNSSDGKRTVGTIGLPKKGSQLPKSAQKAIVGVTPEGTQYYRIKLKPDHMYDDNGLASNEHIVEDTSDNSKKPPASLSLGPQKKPTSHMPQLAQADENRLTPSLSPKPSRQVGGLRNSTGSRSPSPAAVTVSRKSSFCSLFKSKETILSPESPTITAQRKKSAISTLLDSPRDRSRSKSRDSERSGPSQNGTPSKQKSILAIFKPKRSGSKSKSSSPIDHEVMNAMEAPVDIRFIHEPQPSGSGLDSRPKSAQRLRYYDTPADGVSIHIPLHTPPEEKENAFFGSEATKQSVPTHTRTQSHPLPIQTPATHSATTKETTSFHPKNIKPIMTNTTTTTTTTPASRSQTPKIYRIENPDGSVRIPLRSPSEERIDADVDNSNWSTAVQRNSSQESQETVVSSQAPSLTSTDNAGSGNKTQEKSRTIVVEAETTVTESAITPVTSSEAKISTEPPINVQVITASPLTREKKRILFSTRIGSGSDEQIFATQLSLSKTESLSSQLSEQATLDSPPLESNARSKEEEAIPETSKESDELNAAVKFRQKEESSTKQPDSSSQVQSKEEIINSNRHSMYIENIDEILLREKQLDLERKEKQNETVKKPAKIGSREKDTSQSSIEVCHQLRPTLSAEDRAGSSESERSERDSEAGSSISKVHMPRGVGAVEEESAGLVAQDSYDDELPYVPTTLPEERSVALPIIPVKERALMEVKTYPLDRPRSTTPLNPSYLEDYCGSQTDEPEFLSGRGEKLRISLPRKESRDRGQKAKSPRRVSNASGKSWFEFAEQGMGGTVTIGSPSSSSTSIGIARRQSNQDEEPPPIPPRKTQTATDWINFENIPEKRKAPKRITTLPQKDSQEICGIQSTQYNYVNPEECQCECHDIERESGTPKPEGSTEDHSPEDTIPLLESDPDDSPHRIE